MTKSTLYDPEFDADSKYAVKIMVTTRDLELQLLIEPAGQSSQLDILTQKTQTCTRGTTLRRERTPVVNFIFFKFESS